MTTEHSKPSIERRTDRRNSMTIAARFAALMDRDRFREALRLLDEARFESKIEGFKAGFASIFYTDHLRKGRHSHVHRCRQFVRVKNGKIVAIRRSDPRGEARALKSFYRISGVRWE